MIQIFDRMARLPWTTFVWFMSRMVEMVDEMQRTVVNREVPLVPPVEPNLGTKGAGKTGAGADLGKEKAMSENSWSNDEKKVRLFEYTIVNLKRGDEEILEYSQKLVKDPMTESDFNSWVVLDYADKHGVPRADRQYLRVWSRELKSWDKLPLHYEEKQLAVLNEISNKIGPTVQ